MALLFFFREIYNVYYGKEVIIVKNKGTIVKVIGFGAALIGFAATLISNWVEEQKMDEKIDERVNDILDKRNL